MRRLRPTLALVITLGHVHAEDLDVAHAALQKHRAARARCRAARSVVDASRGAESRRRRGHRRLGPHRARARESSMTRWRGRSPRAHAAAEAWGFRSAPFRCMPASRCASATMPASCGCFIAAITCAPPTRRVARVDDSGDGGAAEQHSAFDERSNRAGASRISGEERRAAFAAAPRASVHALRVIDRARSTRIRWRYLWIEVGFDQG